MDWEWTKQLIRLIPVIVFALLFAYLRKASNREIENDSTASIKLRMNRLYLFFGFICIAIAITFIVGLILEPSLKMIILCSSMLLLFGAWGMMCLALYYNHFVIFDKNTICVSSWSGAYRELDWKTIQQIKFNSSWGYLSLKGENNRKLKIHQHLVGFRAFVKAIEENTSWTAQELKIPS